MPGRTLGAIYPEFSLYRWKTWSPQQDVSEPITHGALHWVLVSSLCTITSMRPQDRRGNMLGATQTTCHPGPKKLANHQGRKFMPTNNSQKTKIMASSPTTSWQIDGEKVEMVKDIVFLGFKVTADGDCGHEIKRCLLLGRKAMTNLDSILKSRDINLLTKVCVIKAMFFPIAMYGCYSWTIKAERWRIDAFELWCWRRLLRVPWIARRSSQLILKEINLEYSLEGLMLKMKLQYFGHLMWRANSLEKNLMLGKFEGRRRGWQRIK